MTTPSAGAAVRRAPEELSSATSLRPPAARRERLLSLDVFRGATIAGMLLVNNPGTWESIYPPLQHAAWHGWTPTDLIFPFFLFIVGITTHLSLESRRARGAAEGELVKQILRRGGIIILLGLLLATFPYYPLERFTEIRIPGVLQRIGVVYILAGLLSLRASPRQLVAAAAALLVGYWAAMTLIPVPGVGPPALAPPAATLAAWVDRALLDGHLWANSRTWDPEGILSTVPAVATALLGVLAGRLIATTRPLPERIATLFAVGSIAMVAGLVWNWTFPINKNLWTSSYVLFTGGMAAVALATCMWLIDEKRVTWWTRPFVIYGVNPILAFWGSGALARLIYSVILVDHDGATIPVQAAIYRSAFASWLSPLNASLLFAFCFVLLWLAILTPLHKRGIILKV
ncbi:MAG TPA: heparan-alpha-glucosaminide N-acetyltransferase domain-containing protein [Gemmatimonadaceae bacterium]|nr:heparan-alpha-glucosaminide N-acetyltransferase domain-containing protein [Gemmatimonadaceae bacterium]